MKKAGSLRSVMSGGSGYIRKYAWQVPASVKVSIFLTVVVGIGNGVSEPLQPLVSQASAAQEQAFVAIERSRGLPIRGEPSSKVQQKHGEPVSRKGAVGNPPISSWRYAGFTVYFEYDKVITTVDDQDSLPATLGDIQ